MDFGKLNDVSKVDFSLADDHFFTAQQLKPSQHQPTVYVGPPIWSNREWVGKIYPHYAKEADFLSHYSRQFNTIELNVTHYQIPTLATIQRWREATVTDFKFCPKFPQVISHDRQLIGCDGITQQFCENILALEEKLGCSFLQLNQGFDTRMLPILEKYLRVLPKNFPVAIEFRHPSWFQDERAWAETLAMLQEKNIGTVMTDVAGRRDALHMSLSNSTFMLRFVGNELHPTDFERIKAWTKRLAIWLENGLETAYIFVHCGENIFAPELTKFWIDEINATCGLQIKPPSIQPKIIQGSLF